ncbi:MAG: threonine aldolase [Planctomycetota bacterium]|nr:MAG: threonine aldolase [Planctomycetota bacterium]
MQVQRAPVRDFRSDTVTRPSPAMRRAMAQAEVGDDVFGDDPTAIRLEQRAAELLGKPAALFVPSGTMANLIAFLVHCRPGEEAIVEQRSHVLLSEQGGAARFAGVQLRALAGDARGVMAPRAVAAALRGGPDVPPLARLHNPRTALVVLENTHNFCGGTVQPLEVIRATAAAVRPRGVRVHLDGARLPNACVASGIPLAAWAEPCDSVAISLCKGLGAPAGSVLAGEQEFIAEARRARKALGGGMRQLGVLAAAGLLALAPESFAQLATDHAHARLLAEGLAALPGLEVDLGAVQTNIVFVRHAAGRAAEQALAAALAAEGIGCVPVGELGLRFVTHRDVGRADVEAAIAAVRAWTAEQPPGPT